MGPLRRLHKRMAFDYLVVLGLQATCDEGKNPVVTGENREIIEFSWVTFDVKAGSILDERQFFVKPEFAGGLTPFCTILTNIAADKLVTAISLQDVVREFDSYVHSSFISSSKSFCLLTDGTWEIKVCLRKEAARKQILLPQYFSLFINLQFDFVKAFPDATSSINVKSMLKYLSLHVETTKPRLAIDKCRDVCRVLPALTQAGRAFEPATVPADYDPDTDESVVDNPSSTPELVTRLASTSNELEDFGSCVVRLRGLPYEVTVADVKQFFTDLNVTDVIFVLNFNARPTGEALVRFFTTKEAAKATTFDKQNLGRRYVEVYPSTQNEYDRAVELNGMRASSNQVRVSTCLRTNFSCWTKLLARDVKYVSVQGLVGRWGGGG
eukprot:c8175_g1_i3.p1 GENE.c8175_g1_i3~~c8175_g1_i3.p1  ORF type:complete len:382 (-),score=88.29 c8175_g1_i3:70-1215(-)